MNASGFHFTSKQTKGPTWASIAVLSSQVTWHGHLWQSINYQVGLPVSNTDTPGSPYITRMTYQWSNPDIPGSPYITRMTYQWSNPDIPGSPYITRMTYQWSNADIPGSPYITRMTYQWSNPDIPGSPYITRVVYQWSNPDIPGSPYITRVVYQWADTDIPGNPPSLVWIISGSTTIPGIVLHLSPRWFGCRHDSLFAVCANPGPVD